MNTCTFPEKPETIRMQMDWLREGKRKAVLVTPGAALPLIPLEFATCNTTVGLFIYDPACISYSEIHFAIANNGLGDILGYGTANKPEPGTEDVAVVIRNRNGVEKQSVVVDKERLPAVLAAARDMADPGDKIALEPCDKVVEDRLAGLLDNWPKLLPLKSKEEIDQVMRAAEEEDQHPIYPTHWVEKDGEIVGSVSVSSVPLYLLWLHKDKVKPRETLGILNVIENTYRSNGARLVATMIDGDSPFRHNAERCGYQPASGQLFWRKL